MITLEYTAGIMFSAYLITILILAEFHGTDAKWDWNTTSPLDEYVNRPDPHYRWDHVTQYDLRDDLGCTIYMVNMTSQKWKDETVSNHPIWWHHMAIAVPVSVTSTNDGFLFIAGGNNPTSLPTPESDIFVNAICLYAADTGVVSTYLKHIPNQPFTFTQDPQQSRRSEDDLHGFSWRWFVEKTPNDPEILLRLPMVKASVRAMDTITAVSREVLPSSDVQKYFIMGASKRGWTAWLTAAVDRRVIAVAPMVLSCLNFVESINNHYRALGNWSFAFRPYYRENVTRYLNHPNTQKMADIIDPYEYRERLTMPKLYIGATGDEFFMLHDSHYFWDALPDPKWILMMENTNHGLTLAYVRVYMALVGFHKSIMKDNQGRTIPRMYWMRNETETDGFLSLWTDQQPREVMAWMAATPGGFRRDFRMNSREGLNPIIWTEEDVTQQVPPPGWYHYAAEFTKEPVGWTGFLINALFDVEGEDAELDLSTEVHIIPDTFPFPRCGDNCYGSLV